MVHVTVTICNELGMHARAAARFVQESCRFQSEVWLKKGSNRVNGKSIMGILTLAAARGQEIEIEVQGPDETEALEVLRSLVDRGFEEKKVPD
ncbi:MAG: HPr family phosphocarrier protein [Proteobacteria bacterium]|nr:HPr family phosphocarrier protein [Pseudomonadota bacterium]